MRRRHGADRYKENIDYLFFWEHTIKTGEQVGKFIFNQWYLSPFIVDGVAYSTAEHWMMAGKARLFKDIETLEKISNANTPREAKDLGRQVKGFDAAAWVRICFAIVKDGNYHKFTQNKGYKEYLLATGNKVIVEASPVDTIWGIGFRQDSVQAKNLHHWRGQNLLGFALMEVRDML